MLNPDLCTDAEIHDMVHRFYARIRQDNTLGPIFEARIAQDAWPVHLAKMVDFWSSLLRGTARYQGTPMTKHIGLPDLQASHFEHWLQLFRQTTQELPNQALAARAMKMAERIARSLWLGYQTTNYPRHLARDLNLALPPESPVATASGTQRQAP